MNSFNDNNHVQLNASIKEEKEDFDEMDFMKEEFEPVACGSEEKATAERFGVKWESQTDDIRSENEAFDAMDFTKEEIDAFDIGSEKLAVAGLFGVKVESEDIEEMEIVMDVFPPLSKNSSNEDFEVLRGLPSTKYLDGNKTCGPREHHPNISDKQNGRRVIKMCRML